MSNSHDLSQIKYTNGHAHSDNVVAIVVSKWNPEITNTLYQGCFDTLVEAGVPRENIVRYDVPGSYELPSAANLALSSDMHALDAVVCLGCVIQGETRHFDFICQAVAQSCNDVSIKHDKPVIFGVLTPENMDQAKARAGGNLGNKGCEAAVAALEMIDLRQELNLIAVG